MGSLDTVCITRCLKCSGLFEDSDAAIDHAVTCDGDISHSSCEFVACSRELYFKHILSQKPSFVRRGRPPKHAQNATKTTPPKVSSDPGPAGEDAEGGTPEEGIVRRYGLRKGASQAFHTKISNLHKQLGLRNKPSVPQTDHKAGESRKRQDKEQDKIHLASVDHDRTEGSPETIDIATAVSNAIDKGTSEIQEGKSLADSNTSHSSTKDSGPVVMHIVMAPSVAGSSVVEEDVAPIDSSTESNAHTTTGQPPTNESTEEMPVADQAERQPPDILGEQVVDDDSERENIPGKELERITRSSTRLADKEKPAAMSKILRNKSGFYECSLCTYKTNKEGMFRRHMGAHNDGKMYTCEYCNAQFVYQRLYKQHLGVHKGFQCDLCSKMFSRRHDLSRHIEAAHTTSVKYQCKECGFQCRHHSGYNDHVRKHSRERYQCSHESCGFQTVYRRALIHHVNTVHNHEKHISCTHCEYRTNDPIAASRHRKTHTEEKIFACGFCDYKAISLSYVKAHMVTHRPEKIYSCDQCEYTSARRTGIRSHMMKHIGVKPWQCSNCEYSGTARSKVVRHINMRHKGVGQVNRRNIQIKFDLDSYKNDNQAKTENTDGGEQHEEEKSSNKRAAHQSSLGQEMLLGGHKYMVIEMVDKDSAEGTALTSNLVGQEVVVQQDEPSTDQPVQPNELEQQPTQEGDESTQPGESSSVCLYKCALCEFTHHTLAEVQEHMAVQHADFINAEIIDGPDSLLEEHQSSGVTEQGVETITITMETTETPMEVVENSDQGMQIVYHEGPLEEVQTVAAHHPVQTVTLQDDAVSTAVESILHLQNVLV